MQHWKQIFYLKELYLAQLQGWKFDSTKKKKLFKSFQLNFCNAYIFDGSERFHPIKTFNKKQLIAKWKTYRCDHILKSHI